MVQGRPIEVAIDRETQFDFSVIIANYNGADLLPSCLSAVRRAAGRLRIETIVVDNASTDGSVRLPELSAPGTRVIRLEKNVGFSAANNVGARAALGRYLLLLNTDCFVEPGLFHALADALEECPDVAIAAPRLLNADGTLQPSCHNFPSPLVFLLEQSSLWKALRGVPLAERALQIAGRHNRRREVDWALGACLAVRPEAVEEVGGFDERYFFYWEEADLCKRLREAGWATLFEPAARAVHLGGASTGTGAFLLQFFRSLYRFYRNHYSTVQLLALRALVRSMAAFKAARLLLRSRSDQQARESVGAWARVARL